MKTKSREADSSQQSASMQGAPGVCAGVSSSTARLAAALPADDRAGAPCPCTGWWGSGGSQAAGGGARRAGAPPAGRRPATLPGWCAPPAPADAGCGAAGLCQCRPVRQREVGKEGAGAGAGQNVW